MDWRKTEIIFIIAFLLLDIFLVVMFLNKQATNDPDKLGNDTLQDHLKTDNISYPKLSSKPVMGEIFTATQDAFSAKDVASLKDQNVFLVNNASEISSTLKTPIPADKDKETPELASFVKEKVYKGSSYKFWKYDKEENKLIYNQVIKGDMVLFDSGGQITFKLNNADEAVSYTQTYLGKQDDLQEKTNLMSSMDALEAIYQHGDLKTDSDIVKATFGYYTTVQLSSGDVYFPVWCFEVKHKGTTTYFLINAKDEQVINLNESRAQNPEETSMSESIQMSPETMMGN
ncbi:MULTISPECIES: two-component system regulatory protein YycI [Listeria]|uniref:two-component system regulatory protein YycI n=1 Tax=Listeria TaxID=1637 RepID=UPI000B5983F2|nr:MULTISPECIES: two-component system regulatory protein YycI [Listeria]